MPEDKGRDEISEPEDQVVEEEPIEDEELGEPEIEEGEGEPGGELETEEPATTPSQPVSIPVPVTPVLEKTSTALWGPPEPKKEPPKSGLEDLFEVPEEEDNDMYIDDLFELDEEDFDLEEDLSDLTQVTDEDIMGKAPPPRPAKFTRTSKRYIPPTTMGGLR